MGQPVRMDLSSTGGARGGKLALDVAAASDSQQARAVADLVARHAGVAGGLLPLLHAVQDCLGCVPDEVVPLIAGAMQRSRAEVHGVISFYPHFRRRPVAGVHLEVCRAEACIARGAEALVAHAERRLGCALGQAPADARVSADAVYFIGKNIRQNVRELEGALQRVIHYASFRSLPITLDLVKEALKDILSYNRGQISIDLIQRTVADYYKIKLADM